MFFLVVLTAVLVSCGHNREKPVDQQKPASEGKAVTQKDTISLALYYVKYTNNDAYLVREIHRVPYTQDGPRAAVNELINTPPVTEGAARTLPKDTRLLDINVTDGLATVNFSREVLSANVGTSGEGLGIQSIVNTLTEFPQIREVSFQVEGKVDSRTLDWWGHVGLYEQPFKRNLDRVLEPAVWITHPAAGQVAGVPLLVKGSARALEGQVNARLLDSSGNKIAEDRATLSRQAAGRVDFEMKLTFTPPGKGSGTLEVSLAGPGNLPGNTVKIPIQWP
ncbi:MAG: GerMN domain-containing protein [Peptococcaceae bacterium]|nr:GerMN domain-containing protein [Peptococcaceae bacterium]